MEGIAIAKATIYGGLDPVDLKRCQTEKRQPLSPFTMGGNIQGEWLRCDRVPSWVAIEAEPDKLTKTRGAMSLCRSCLKYCKEKRPEGVLYESAAPFKAAHKLGGHQAVRDMVYGYKALVQKPRAPVRTGLHARRKSIR